MNKFEILKYEGYDEDWNEEDDPTEVEACDGEDAAEQLAERYDQEEVEYPGKREINVREKGTTEWTKYMVYAESVRHYHARIEK